MVPSRTKHACTQHAPHEGTNDHNNHRHTRPWNIMDYPEASPVSSHTDESDTEGRAPEPEPEHHAATDDVVGNSTGPNARGARNHSTRTTVTRCANTERALRWTFPRARSRRSPKFARTLKRIVLLWLSCSARCSAPNRRRRPWFSRLSRRLRRRRGCLPACKRQLRALFRCRRL